MNNYYYLITSHIGGEMSTEGFYLDSELDLAMDDLDYFSHLRLDDYFPLEDGSIGFYSINGYVELEERCLMMDS